MNHPKELSEILPQKASEELAGILRETIENYVENYKTVPVDTWLENYLTVQLPERSAEEIGQISNDILEAVRLHDSKMASMHEAVKNGTTAENWFANEVLASGRSAGGQAKTLVECSAVLTEISNSYEEPSNQKEIIDVEAVSQEEWADDKWNSYRLKDALMETALDAGEVALKNTADDLYAKVLEHGVQSVLTDKELISESVLYGADSGLKVATSSALRIAADRSIVAQLSKETSTNILADIAGLAIENVRVLGKITQDKVSLTDGLSMIKNNTVATVAGIFGQKQGASIGAAIGTVLGPVGTVVGGFVGSAVGKFAGSKIGHAVVNAGRNICSAAKTVVSSIGNAVRSVGNAIKNFFKW